MHYSGLGHGPHPWPGAGLGNQGRDGDGSSQDLAWMPQHPTVVII